MSLAAGEYFVITVTSAGSGLTNEIMQVTAVSGDTFTVTRAQEGSAAQAWSAADIIQNLMTAGQLDTIEDQINTIDGQIATLNNEVATLQAELPPKWTRSLLFTASVGTHTGTFPSDCTYVWIQCSGGGGGGASGFGGDPSVTPVSGAGGGAGGYGRFYINVTPGSSWTVTVGDGGAGGSANAQQSGGNGFTTSVSWSTGGVQLTGGQGGIWNSSVSSSGGQGGGTTINPGSTGGPLGILNAGGWGTDGQLGTYVFTGNGGAGLFPTGGRAGAGHGEDAGTNGCGGGGGYSGITGQAAAGGNGAPGFCEMWY
ncbi:MAG TPA: hypothetical protein VGC09_00545 [Rhodopila sp.]